MFPIKDVNRPSNTPHVNRMLIVTNVVILLVMVADLWWSEGNFATNIWNRFAMTPQDIIHGEKVYTVFTSMFLHAGLLHLFGNMLYLHIFGDNVEDVFGHLGYFFFYVVCGLAATSVHILSITTPTSYTTPVVGASGTISGVLGAYLVLYPKAKILTVVLYGFPIIVPIPAILFLGFWFLMQWFLGVQNILVIKSAGGVAYWAHVGGFVAGVILALIFGSKRKRSREQNFGV